VVPPMPRSGVRTKGGRACVDSELRDRSVEVWSPQGACVWWLVASKTLNSAARAAALSGADGENGVTGARIFSAETRFRPCMVRK